MSRFSHYILIAVTALLWTGCSASLSQNAQHHGDDDVLVFESETVFTEAEPTSAPTSAPTSSPVETPASKPVASPQAAVASTPPSIPATTPKAEEDKLVIQFTDEEIKAIRERTAREDAARDAAEKAEFGKVLTEAERAEVKAHGKLLTDEEREALKKTADEEAKAAEEAAAKAAKLAEEAASKKAAEEKAAKEAEAKRQRTLNDPQAGETRLDWLKAAEIIEPDAE